MHRFLINIIICGQIFNLKPIDRIYTPLSRLELPSSCEEIRVGESRTLNAYGIVYKVPQMQLANK